ncbi:MAG TPA: hypothetical protein VKI44_23080 [Acetobacteraceae bacterium]|jgi:hypothetical protein|nr:hypothetical protein [Acetobacteraceae bacterium]
MTGDRPADWPADVDPISLEDLGRIGINSQQELFWDGRRVEVRRRFILTGFQKLIAFIVSICAILGALGGFVTGFNNASVFLCARNITILSCPTSPIAAAPTAK